MGKTSISWTDYSWNPWIGCRKVSLGCKNCFMFRDQKRYGNDPTEIRRSKTTFDYPLSLMVHKETKGTLIFVCSWSDFFLEEADEWRDEAWDIIRRTPHLTYQILTKRPENILSRLPDDWGDGWENVWLGVSIENHKQSKRGWRLTDIPSRVRFISIEPLLDWVFINGLLSFQDFHWVIVGGESGSNCRPMKLEWARLIQDACKQHGIAFFMKQDSGPKPGMRGRIPEDLWIQQFPDVNRA